MREMEILTVLSVLGKQIIDLQDSNSRFIDDNMDAHAAKMELERKVEMLEAHLAAAKARAEVLEEENKKLKDENRRLDDELFEIRDKGGMV